MQRNSATAKFLCSQEPLTSVHTVQAVSGLATTIHGGHTFFLTLKCSHRQICAVSSTAAPTSADLTKTQPVTLCCVSLLSAYLLRLCVTIQRSAQRIRSATTLKIPKISEILLQFVTDLSLTFIIHLKRQAKTTI